MLLVLFCFTAETAMAQVQTYKEMHKVKRKETIFGIARENGLTVQELIDANPEMKLPGYELKKGDYIRIPFPSDNTNAVPASSTQEINMPTKPQVVVTDMRQREIRVGVMLPLHNINGDGKRMVEYYRGILMACDSLRANGISTDVRAWNVAEDTDINEILKDPHAADRDVIIGPLYTKQVKALGDFAREHNIRVMIPFSINSQEVFSNALIFQVYQNGNVLNDGYVARFYERYKNYHTVIIDCNDTTSTKGGFTSALRRKLEMEGKKYSITNLRSSEAMFQKSFSTTEPNVAVGSMRIFQNLIDIRVFSYIPCTDICRDAVSTQAVASHQYASIVFHHTLAVAIDIMQGQHDTYTNLALSHIGLQNLRLGRHADFLCRRFRCCIGGSRGEWNLDVVALLQFVAG